MNHERQLDPQDFAEAGDRPDTDTAPPVPLATLQPSQGSFDWAATDQFIGRLASHGVRSMPFLWGSPSWVAGSQATPPLESAADRQAWRGFLKAAVTRYGPGGSYWANGYRQQFGAERHAAADPVLADLERAQPGEVLRAEPIARQVRPAAADLPRRDQEPGSAGPDRARRHARLRESEVLGLPRRPLRHREREGQLRRRGPAPLRLRDREGRERVPAVPPGDEGAQRRADAALGHGDRLGIEPSRPVRNEQGPRGPGEAARGSPSR